MTDSFVESIPTRRFVLGAAGILGAPMVGWNLAHGNLLLPALFACALLLAIFAHWIGVLADALVGGLLIFGYLVGNRGFAQLNVPGVPLLPGEAVLGVALALTGWRAARTWSFPFRRDGLNACILIWMAIGLARIPFDLRAHQFVAVRDFATIYYALFFFFAQTWASHPSERHWLIRCLTLGLALCGIVFYLFDLYQDWFTSSLTVAGVPIIYVKSDVAGGFMAAAVIWFAFRFAGDGRIRWLAIGGVSLVGVVVCNSRAAIVGLVAGSLWLAVLRAWRPLRSIVGLSLLGLFILSVQAAGDRRPFTATPLYRLYETVASVADFSGTRRYQATNLSDKPDNNQFRLVWWRTVVDETLRDGLWFGLGFGRDLAVEFLRVYYADANDDFTARSPHNFLLTVFGRMGVVGIGALLALLTALSVKTWRAGYSPPGTSDYSRLPIWVAGWAVLTSACFGVVLEGPMGAVVFWTLLGLANAEPIAAEAESDALAASPAQVRTDTADAATSAHPALVGHSVPAGGGRIFELSLLANVAGVADPGTERFSSRFSPASARPATRQQLGDAPAGGDLRRNSSPPGGEPGSLSARPDREVKSYPDRAFAFALRPTNSP